LRGCVPATWLAKLKVRVSQALAMVVRVSVSTETPAFVWSSTLRRTGRFAAGV
jgi:hypothetical protein